VIDNQTRSVASIIEAAYLAGELMIFCVLLLSLPGIESAQLHCPLSSNKLLWYSGVVVIVMESDLGSRGFGFDLQASQCHIGRDVNEASI